jgi:hypothetical protein
MFDIVLEQVIFFYPNNLSLEQKNHIIFGVAVKNGAHPSYSKTVKGPFGCTGMSQDSFQLIKIYIN